MPIASVRVLSYQIFWVHKEVKKSQGLDHLKCVILVPKHFMLVSVNLNYGFYANATCPSYLALPQKVTKWQECRTHACIPCVIHTCNLAWSRTLWLEGGSYPSSCPEAVFLVPRALPEPKFAGAHFWRLLTSVVILVSVSHLDWGIPALHLHLALKLTDRPWLSHLSLRLTHPHRAVIRMKEGESV